MAYDIYLDGVRLPVTPSKLDLKIKNQNRTLNLINDGEINIIKQSGLTDISFSALLPNTEGYSFAVYEDGGFRPAADFINLFETLKNQTDNNGKPVPFAFVLSRTLPDGKVMQGLSMDVSLQDYTLAEDHSGGFDVMANISLKEYRHYGVKTIKITNDAAGPVMEIEEVRPATKAPQNTTYTVRPGDTLRYIAQAELDDCERWEEIYNLNRVMIDAQNVQFGGLRGDVYANQVLQLPRDGDKNLGGGQ